MKHLTRALIVASLCGQCAGCGEDEPAPYVVHESDRGGDDDGPRAGRGDDDEQATSGTGDVEGETGAGGQGSDAPNAGTGGTGGDGSAGDTSGAGEPAPPPGGCEGGSELRVLFIGNSHTYTNDVPALVRELACAAGTRVISQSSTPGGVGFVEHATDANTLAAIEADAWDFVVMQDQQQRPGFRLEEVEEDHLPPLQTLVDAIAAHRSATRTVMYMVWARSAGDTDNCDYYPLLCSFEANTVALSQGYRFYAERTGSMVAPAALAWAAVHADPEAPFPVGELWSDGSHAGARGSYLAAAVIVGTLLDVETAGLAYDGGHAPEIAAYLRGVADQLLEDERDDPRVSTEERVRIACSSGGCSTDADAKAVTFTLSSDDCDALADGDAEAQARIHTTLSCRGSCTTVALGAWHELAGGAIDDDSYQVHAWVDLDDDGELGEGDLEACEEGFEVGGGEDLVLTELTAR